MTPAATKRAGLKPAPTFFCVPCVLCGFFVFFAAFAVKFAALGPPSWSKLFTGHISKSNRRPISNAAVFFFFSDGPQTLPELALLCAELLGHPNIHTEKQISSPFSSKLRKALAFQSQHAVRLGAGRDCDPEAAIQREGIKTGSEHGVRNWNLLSMPEIRAVTLEAGIRRGSYNNIKISGRAAGVMARQIAGITFARKRGGGIEIRLPKTD